MELKSLDFGENFAFGVSTSAYQAEGAHLAHGKGPSIWDDFTQKKGKIRLSQNANVACDFYHNYHQDLALMRAMNIRNFRFSMAWSRLFPNGTGTVNKAGVDFYKRVIDFCLELEIEPWITLYHWDLPLELQKKGGWANRLVIDWFSEYASFCVKTFGDRVKNWMILNEPMVFTGAGYFLGIHAPGKKGLASFLPAVHHAALAQAQGGRILRSFNGNFNIGSTFSCSHVEAISQNENDVLAAYRVDALLNRTFVEPLLGLGYPVNDVKILQRLEPYVLAGDEEKLKFDMDFIGIQNYTREIVSYSYFAPFLQARIVKADRRNVERSLMNWEVYPESIYRMLKKYSSYPQIRKIIVTENGAAFEDVVEDGTVNDARRKNFICQNIEQMLRAKKEGINVGGYFLWTFTDNFEWAEGYLPRFGLVHVDFSTQKRTVKASGHWYSNFLSRQVPECPHHPMINSKIRV
jgi:beta-glucosidase